MQSPKLFKVFGCNLIALFAIGVVRVSFAEDVSWALGSGGDFATAANWINTQTGVTAESAPTAAGDVARFDLSTAAAPYAKKIFVPTSLSGSTLGTIVGTDEYALRLFAKPNVPEVISSYSITLSNPNEFKGLIYSEYPTMTLTLPATAEFTPVLHDFDSSTRITISVPTAGTKAKIGALRGEGAFNKTGSGTLEIESVTGLGSQSAYLSGGTIQLDGEVASGEPTDIIADAYLQLDASRPETFLGYTGEDGRTYVTNWTDPRAGASVYAKKARGVVHSTGSWIEPGMVHAPFLTVTNGMTYVDFGASSAESVDTLGPTNCVLETSTVMKNVREVFFAAARSEPGTMPTHVIGSADNTGFAYNDFYGARDTLFNQNAAATTNGYVSCNGVKCTFSDVPTLRGGFGTTHVVNVGSRHGAYFNLIGSDRYLPSSGVGGFRLGELIVFTNKLSAAERSRVSRYLMKKWIPREFHEADDLGYLQVNSDSAAISVPAGRVARIGKIKVAGTKVVKKGGGRLEIGTVYPATASVQVDEGDVSIDAAERPTDAPAQTPYVWVDANTGLTTTQFSDGITNFVSRWDDAAGGARYYTSPGNTAANMPYVVDSGVGDLKVVSFGAVSTSTSTGRRMQFSVGGDREYEGFLVLRLIEPLNTANSYNFFGSNGYDTFRGSWSKALISTYREAPYSGAYAWSVDGAPFDPRAELGFATGEFHVLSVSAQRKIFLDYLAFDRGAVFGGIEIGEFIAYDRRLSPSERRQTIAYLMRRWKGTTPRDSDVAARSTGVRFADGIPATISSDSAACYGAVTGGDGTYVKVGAGAATISSVDIANLDSIAVSNGTLAVSDMTLQDASAFHVDATAADSFTLRIDDDDDGDGAVRTNVVRWADVRGNGRYAFYEESISYNNYTVNIPTNPTLSAVTINGSILPAVDFGIAESDTAAGLRFTASVTGLREAHVVFRMRSSGAPLGPFTAYNSRTLLPGGWASALFHSTFQPNVDNVWTNGVSAPVSLASPTAMRSLAMQTALDKNCTVNTFAIDEARYNNCGGPIIAEAMYFTNRQSDVEYAYTRDKLYAKWFGVAAPLWTNSVDSVYVAPGSTLDLGSGTALSVPSVAGGGEIGSDAVVGVSSFALEGPLEIGGRLELAGSGTISIVPGFDIRQVGRHVLVTAAEYGDIDLSGWSFVPADTRNRRYSLVFADGSICVDVESTGLKIIAY